MVHPLCGFIALRDSLVISSCSAGFGFCPLILQTLVFQHSAAKAAHTSGVYSVIKSSKPKHLASYGYIFREEMPLSGLCLLFHWVSRDPLPPPTCTAWLPATDLVSIYIKDLNLNCVCVCVGGVWGCGSLAASISSLISTAFLALNFDLEHYYSVSCSVISNALWPHGL